MILHVGFQPKLFDQQQGRPLLVPRFLPARLLLPVPGRLIFMSCLVPGRDGRVKLFLEGAVVFFWKLVQNSKDLEQPLQGKK